MKEVNEIVEKVKREFFSATGKHGSFNSAHEGYAVILEELDELWEEIKLKNPSSINLENEAIQVAAMAIRFVYDIKNNSTNQ